MAFVFDAVNLEQNAWWYGVLLLEKDINWELVESVWRAPIILPSFFSFIRSFFPSRKGRKRQSFGDQYQGTALCIVRFKTRTYSTRLTSILYIYRTWLVVGCTLYQHTPVLP
ncbi:hypothetical protein PNOK_0277100 [Pyrrhoderma noxium]|uniref:Uncharacterized protein n=1 Tax=Pyrrhoderma noxium TaxID=2282107 RepID=A0A286UTD5_9AGAM|nr:hypothetical protein PNOK_0277100 [Pyrrhoderma noxium]